MKAYKISLALDCACIVIAVIVLYCANNALLPMWALIAGATVAFVLLVAAVMQLLKARRCFKKEAEQRYKEMRDDADSTPQE
ncbi:MAG: hypothetical protein MJZ74_06205 [Muribaculaceae bacterium]|nr:hypothetical protein [Muribaculaceae bacterium]